jgi:Mrr N-terminal domain
MMHLLDALRALGGRGTCSAVYGWLEEHGIARPEDLTTIQTDKGTSFKKEVRWARKELFDAGLLGNKGRGHWYLTSVGQTATLDHVSANRLVADNRERRRLSRQS